MLPILALATLALATPAPITVSFTSDSVYKNESIISPKEVIEQDDGLYTIVLEEDKLLGYCIYDNKETAHIDGLKFDDEFVVDWMVKDVDLAVEHTILVKTTYTDDIAGMLASAKNGDWSRALANPLILFQLFYYIIAALSIILGGFGIFKSKDKKVKSANEISSVITKKTEASATFLQDKISSLINDTINPVVTKLQTQNQKIIEAFILSQSGGKDSRLALIDLLKSTAIEDTSLISDTASKAVEEAFDLKEKAKAEADKTVKEIAEGVFEDKKDDANNVRF